MRILKDNDRKYCFMMDMEVRDYELDCEQIVNNANYLHYMEHTRHCFCKAAGFSFNEMCEQGIVAVARKIEIEYLSSLRGGDSFVSALRIVRKGVRFIFYQDIFKSDGEMCARGVVTIVAVKDGKLSRGDELAAAFGKYIGR